VSEETRRMQALGEAGETCHECGAPLAVDQRYCLNCGRRRSEPRVDFRQHLPTENGAVANGSPPPTAGTVPPAAAPPAPEKPQRDYAPLAAVGGIAVLGLMLLVGVLIGRGGDDGASAPPVQVIRPEGEAGASPTAGEGDSKGTGPSAGKQAKGKGKAESAKDLASGKGSAGAPVEASDEALQQLQEQTPEEYQESSAKLPDEIATGGAPPPKDNKAPGAGSKGTAIE
jgi:hypothetical protein